VQGARSFQIKSPPVVLETVDEETIIVNLDTGSYYDLNHTGGWALQAIDAGGGVDAAIDAVAQRYDVERETVAEPVRRIVVELVAEGILVPADETGAPVLPPPTANGSGSRPYQEPQLGKYTDMQELLLLDPVHEVDEAGWPNKA
jgi:hypothetical protein